jgi:hypothetical protein
VSGRTFVTLEDRDPVEASGRLALTTWQAPPGHSARSGRYTTALEFLAAMARAVEMGIPLPDVALLDDVVPFDPYDPKNEPVAAIVAAGLRHLAATGDRVQPRIVVMTGATITGPDILAMLEFGADDVVRKGDLVDDAAVRTYYRQLGAAIDGNRAPGHATNARKIRADWWPPNPRALEGVTPSVRAGLLSLLPLLPLWDSGLDREELVDRHFRDGVSERQIRPDMRTINQRYVPPRRVLGKALVTKEPLRGPVARGLRQDGVLWVSEETRNRVLDLPWSRILSDSSSGVAPPVGPPVFASALNAQLRSWLYPISDDPRATDGGDCIYRARVT